MGLFILLVTYNCYAIAFRIDLFLDSLHQQRLVPWRPTNSFIIPLLVMSLHLLRLALLKTLPRLKLVLAIHLLLHQPIQ